MEAALHCTLLLRMREGRWYRPCWRRALMRMLLTRMATRLEMPHHDEATEASRYESVVGERAERPQPVPLRSLAIQWRCPLLVAPATGYI